MVTKAWIGYFTGILVGLVLAFGLGAVNAIAFMLLGGTFALVGLLIGARLANGE